MRCKIYIAKIKLCEFLDRTGITNWPTLRRKHYIIVELILRYFKARWWFMTGLIRNIFFLVLNLIYQGIWSLTLLNVKKSFLVLQLEVFIFVFIWLKLSTSFSVLITDQGFGFILFCIFFFYHICLISHLITW